MTTDSKRTFVLASRASKLAQVQTRAIQAALQAAHPDVAFDVLFLTGAEGDKNKTDALYLLGGKALWTSELEAALAMGRADMLVHCLKDMPTVLPDGRAIGAIPEREDPLDAFVVKKGKENEWKSLDDLPAGSVVGTSSIRRVALLRRAYPKLVFLDARGNIDTRLKKLDDPEGPYTSLILAAAGLKRLDLGGRITASLTAPTLYYAVSQGALCIEVREDDAEALRRLTAINDADTHWSCEAERACLRVLEGGCSVPVGVVSTISAGADGTRTLELTGTVTSIDGKRHYVHTASAPVARAADALALGEQVAHALVASGAKAILAEIEEDRKLRRAAQTGDALGVAGSQRPAEEVAKIEAVMEGTA